MNLSEDHGVMRFLQGQQEEAKKGLLFQKMRVGGRDRESLA